MLNILSLPIIWILIYSLMTEVKTSMGWRTWVQVTATLKWEKSPQQPVLYLHDGSAEKYTPVITWVRPISRLVSTLTKPPKLPAQQTISALLHFSSSNLILRSWTSHLSYFCKYTAIDVYIYVKNVPENHQQAQELWQWPY